MIYYRPTDGDVLSSPIRYRPRTCFLMTQLGQPLEVVTEIRAVLGEALTRFDYRLEDAEARTTGKDFLLKIWGQIIAVPAGIAIIDRGMAARTIGNIFYEMGLMQAYGKETLIVKTRDTQIPSDFVRTEYVEYGDDFDDRIGRFMTSTLELADHYGQMAELVERNPLLAIDYCRRAYLISGEETWQGRAKDMLEEAALKDRARNSVESLMASFIE